MATEVLLYGKYFQWAVCSKTTPGAPENDSYCGSVLAPALRDISGHHLEMPHRLLNPGGNWLILSDSRLAQPK